jgi:Quinohemoprotein amine dehydrogenase A, alpha subunit, haem binding
MATGSNFVGDKLIKEETNFDEFLADHPEYDWMRDLLNDLKTQLDKICVRYEIGLCRAGLCGTLTKSPHVSRLFRPRTVLYSVVFPFLNTMTSLFAKTLVYFGVGIFALLLQNPPTREEGAPVTDPLVKEKCGVCHTSDEKANMQRISWERATPEAWELALQRMVLLYDVDLTPAEKEHVIQYLSGTHGLAPEEAQRVTYDVERRIHEDTDFPESVTKPMPQLRPCNVLAAIR